MFKKFEKVFNKTLIALAVELVVSSVVFAQEKEVTLPKSGEPVVEKKAKEDDKQAVTVVVTGSRASLARALDIKRHSATVQDSISALELGRFPDDNVADSLSHITGVSIKRTAGGEGQKVSIRGLGPEFTLSTFNGRILGTDGAGRDFAYDVLPADVINGADVIKGAQAMLQEGGIGGLVNLRSASPFDDKGEHGVFRVEGDHNLMSKLNGSKLTATYSNTFADNTMGFLGGVVYAKRKARTDTAGNDGGWSRNPSDDPSWLWGNTWGGAIDPNNNGIVDENEKGLIGPGQFRVGSVMEQQKRLALSGKFEWRPAAGIKVVADGIFTRLDSPQIGYQQSFYPLFAPGRWSDVTVKNGIVTDFTMNNPDPELRLNPELLNKSEHRVVDTSMYGLNAAWQVTSDLNLVGDLYKSKSKRHSGGLDTYVVLRMNQPNTSHISLTGSSVPSVVTTFDDGRDLSAGLAANKFGAADFNTHYLSLGGDNIDDDITGTSIDGRLSVDKFFLDQVRFGVNTTARKKSRDLVNNSLTGGADYYSGTNAIKVSELGGNVISHSFTLPNFMNKVEGNFPRSFLAFDVPSYLARLEAYNGHPRPDGGTYDYSKAAATWNPQQSYRVTEKTTASYMQGDFSGNKWSGDVGVRLVKTRTSSQAWEAKINSITENGEFNYTAEYAAPTSVTQNSEYTFALPSANFVWHVTNDFQARLSAAKTMARPSVEKLAPTSTTESVSWGEFTQVYGGNAELKPYSAVQTDLSLEWYYAPKSIFNVAFFKKNIRNQITSSWQTGQDIGVAGYLFNVSRPINGDYAKVSGVEVGLQHFWDNGFGVRAQYTHNKASSVVGTETRPLEGVAPATSSIGGSYEKGPWSLSLTADKTDGFVTAVNVLGSGYDERVKAITWLSSSISYTVNDRLQLTFEGRNLLDAQEVYTIAGNPLLAQGYHRYGRAFTLGASIRF